ncbi:hypothetical protein [Blastopirellula marina]|nr:hypothetical protein [Blastopirellula marina]
MLIGFPLAWVFGEYYRLEQRLALVAEIDALGGTANARIPNVDFGPPSLPQRLAFQIFGERYLWDILSVELPAGDVSAVFPSLDQRPYLYMLCLHESSLSDTDIEVIASLQLRHLTLNGTRLTPKQFQRLGTISTLESLELSGAAASDAHLRQLPSFTQLPFLWLKGIDLSPESLKPLAGNPNLEVLVIESSSFDTDEAFEPITKLHQLRQLNLNNTPIDESMLEMVSQMNGLRGFSCSHWGETPLFECTATDVAKLRSLGTLRRLNLIAFALNDETLRGLGQITQLESLGIDGSQVTEKGLLHLRGLEQLKEITLFGAQLSDEKMRRLEEMPALQWLSIGGNKQKFRSEHFDLFHTDADNLEEDEAP